MATLDHLIDGLRGEGSVESEGHFTLDRAQAKAKMQKFQLADARRYVLELVQAAVLRGATRIAFEIDADDMRVGFDGEAFSAAELDDLYGSLFREGQGPTLEGLRQLALALNAAMGMNPKFIRLRSGAVSLRMVPGHEDEISEEEPVAGTQIHVKQRLRPRMLLDVFLNLRGRLGEEQYLRERCCYARTSITLDGKTISHGPHPPAGSFGAIELTGELTSERYRVLVAAADSHPSTELRLVKSGVWIDSLELEGAGSSIVAIAESDRLRKDVSQTKIVHDAALHEILEAVRRARWRVWAAAKAAAAAHAEQDSFRLRRVSGLIESLLLFHADAAALRADPHGLELAADVCWSDCRDLSRQVSLRELLALDEDTQIQWARESFPTLEAEDPPVLLIPDEHERTMLTRVLGDRLVASDELLARAHQRERNREAWLEREGEPVLPTHIAVLSSGPLRVKEGPLELRGEVSIDRETLGAHDHPVHMLLYKRRRLLGRLELELDIPNVWLVVDAEFAPTEDYRDAVRDKVFVSALLRALAALRQPLAKVLADARGQSHELRARRLAKRWLTSLLVPKAQAGMLASAGVDVRPGYYMPPAELLPELLRLGVGDGARDQPAAACLVAQPLFRQLGGPDLSLRELAARVEAEGKLSFLPGAPTDPRLVLEGVAVLGPGDVRILRALFDARFGEGKLEQLDIDPELRALRHADQAPYDWKERLLPQLDSTGARAATWAHASQELDAVLIPAFAALGYSLEQLDEALLSTSKLIVLVDQRVVCELELELGLGPLVVVAEDPRLRPDASWKGIERDAGFEAFVGELKICAHDLFRQMCAQYERELVAVQSWSARVLLHAVAAARARDQDWIPASGFERLPLFDTVAGRRVSLREVEAIAAQHGGRVELVGRDTSWTPVKAPEILKLEADEAKELYTLLGVDLVDGSLRVLHQAAFASLEASPLMHEATLDRDEVLGVVALEHERRGEIGISRSRREPGLNMRLGVAGRQVEVLEGYQQGVWLPLEAAVHDDELPLTAAGEPDRQSKRYRALLRQLRRSAAELIEGLCAGWEQFDAGAQADAWRVLVMHLEAEAEVERGKARDRAFACACEVSGFRDAGGRRYSLEDLLARGTKQPLRALGRLRPAIPQTPGAPILLLDDEEISCLEDGFDFDVELIDDSWAQHLAWLETLADAPLVERPDFDEVALAYRKAQAAGGIKCELWIPADYSPLTPMGEPPELQVEIEGCVVGGLSLLEILPCAGLLSGPGVELHVENVSLEARERSSLIRQLLITYLDLAQALRAGKLHGEKHTRGLEYMAWIDMCVEYGVDELDELESDRKRARELIRSAAELTPPSLRESLRRNLADTQRESEAEVEVELDSPPRAPTPAEGAPSRAGVESVPMGPAPGATDPRTRLLAAVYEQLHWARERHGELLDELRLSRLELRHLDSQNIAEVDFSGVMLNTGHPIVARLLAQPRHDLIDLSFLVAALYSLMNYAAEKISDDDERLFVAQLAESLALSLRVHSPR